MAGTRAKRKRPYGDGGYRKIGPGRYKARITLPDGSRPSKSGTLAVVEGWLNERTHDLQRGVIPPKSTTVAAYGTRWLAEIALEAAKGKAATPRSGTMTGYRRMVNNYLIRALGGWRMEDVGREQIVDLYSWLRVGQTPTGVVLSRGGMHLKARTLVHFHHLLQSLFARAEVERLITRNPMLGIKTPGIPDDEDFEGKALSLSEWRRLLECAAAVPGGASVIAAAILGNRRGEVLGLTWDDIHLSDEIPWLTIEQSLQRVTGNGLVPQKAKTKLSRRYVAVGEVLSAALQIHRESGLSGQHWVFTSPRSRATAMAPEYHWRRVWKPIRDAAGLTMRPHDMRHTVKTLVTATRQAPESFMNSYFGWVGGDMSAHYTHLQVEQTKVVADIIDELARG